MADASDVDRRVARVHRALVRYHDESGSRYVKAREIGTRLGLSPKQVGQALRVLREHGTVEKWGRSSATSWRIIDEDASEVRADGGREELPSTDEVVAEEGADSVDHHPEGVRSAPAAAPEFRRPDTVPIEDQCAECGQRGSLRCGCCGFPLCGKHHELGAGFCSRYHETVHPACVWPEDVYVFGGYGDVDVLVTDPDADVFHLSHHDEDTSNTDPLCSSDGDMTTVACSEVDTDLCDDCEDRLRDLADDDDHPAMVTDGGAQTDLGRDPTTREVARPDHDERNRPLCPDCGQYVGASKGGGKPLPDHEATAFGWECADCELTLPSNCSGRAAPMFNDHMAGLKVLFRDGTPRWVPVPERFVDDDDTDVATDGGREVLTFEVADDRPAISYGPDPYRNAEWCLSATTGEQKVELLLGERAMYRLWTEVRGVPWPDRSDVERHATQDRLIRQLLDRANGADEEMLREALAVLEGRDAE